MLLFIPVEYRVCHGIIRSDEYADHAYMFMSGSYLLGVACWMCSKDCKNMSYNEGSFMFIILINEIRKL